jgi:hypothetical protein
MLTLLVVAAATHRSSDTAPPPVPTPTIETPNALEIVDIAVRSETRTIDDIISLIRLREGERIHSIDGVPVRRFADWFIERHPACDAAGHYCPPIAVELAAKRYIDLSVVGSSSSRRVLVLLH